MIFIYSRYWLCSLVYCAASNIFFLPSIPDMASTFFLQSLTSTVFSYKETHKHKCRRELCNNNAGLSNAKLVHISQDARHRPPAHLLCVFLLDGLEVCSQVHGHLVFGAQQRAQDGVSRDSDSPQSGSLEFASQVQDFDVQVLDLQQVCLKVSSFASSYWAIWFLDE